jgi:dihydroxyacetone kinase phosphoprotein-dependent L subunit
MTDTLGSHLGVAELSRWIHDFARLISENKDYLTALDSAIGDADHGINMDRGMTAVVAGLDGVQPSSPGDLFKHVGMTLVSSVGGASGPLFGTFFLRVAAGCGDKAVIEPAVFAAALRSGLDGVVARGKAEAGDKTMYDALEPAVSKLEGSVQSGRSLAEGLREACAAGGVRPRRHDSVAGAQGPRKLLGRAQRGSPGSRCDNGRPAVRVRCQDTGVRNMVGVVVVSHSRALADAAVALARQMLHGRDVPIAVAAGLDETTLGTDAMQIKSAIEAVDGPDGTLVLMDLGSAVLSTELALDLLDPSIGERVALCAGPLVEGLVVATVAAAGGASLADVAQEALNALAGKQSHLGPVAPASHEDAAWNPSAVGVFVVRNEHGLHARPAARLVGEVRGLDSHVMLRNLTTGSPAVPAASLSRVATLGALRGHEIEVAADGRQAREAVDHLLALAARDFDEAAADQAATGDHVIGTDARLAGDRHRS